MDLVSPIKDVLTGLWDCAANHSAYIRHLEDNLASLEKEKLKLDAIFKDVKQIVEREEKHYKIRTNQVANWWGSVERTINEVDDILRRGVGNEAIQKKCLGSCCPRNCRTSYRLGKEVIKRIEAVKELIKDGNFSVFAERLPLPPVDRMPVDNTVGMDSKLSEVWRCVKEDGSVGILGLYGTGGVGKTTLLTKLNNKFFDTRLDFDVVIWVTVSKEVNLEKIQEVIRNKLEISDERWKDRKDEHGKAAEIFESLSSRKFVLLLDDLWETIELSSVGVPRPDDQNGCKIIITSRSEDVCRKMGVRDRGSFKVDFLSPEEAFELFRNKVTEDVLNSHHEIPELARTVADECKGLPLALITIGRAMSNRRKPEEWRHAINTLENNPSKLPGVEDPVFSSLKFSYDSLPGDSLKNCFLYCCIFPEDHEINKHELIRLWIAEGFLDNSGTLDNAINEGEYIIQSLISACLLERVAEVPENFVKMHDVLRDFAMWLSSEKDNKVWVLENDRLSKKQGITAWQETVRITLWGPHINDCNETPICSRLLTLVARETRLGTFPSAFFESMEALKVLDLKNNPLTKLPEVRKLVNLQHLDLSYSRIEELPIEVKNLTKLRILLLDNTRRLRPIAKGVISSLSSLQVFSRLLHTYSPTGQFWETGLLEELKQLDNIEEISLTLSTPKSVNQLKSDLKLRSSVKRLNLNGRDWLSLDISPGDFQNLHDLTIVFCSIKDLTCLIHAPCLRFLVVIQCSLLEEIIGKDLDSSEIDENLNVFQNLKILNLFCLPRLKSICSQVVPFPSLESMHVVECPNLQKLPFKSVDAKATTLARVTGRRDWWEGLEWEDEATKGVFTSKFVESDTLYEHYVYEEAKATRPSTRYRDRNQA